ncbi:hypothetical protein ACIROD_07145 [Peribacillus sp. NPDC101481]|uniref:hypothetical protein n=1 Tax=Peribacillus sp. NPDC101481 TaxID=3364403 RepID=UPI0037FA87E3
MKEKYPYLLVILGAMLWGTTGTAQSFAPDGAHPIAIGGALLALGAGASYTVYKHFFVAQVKSSKR